MLKIKNDVDLKELEKYGFKEFHGENNYLGDDHIDGYEYENKNENFYSYILVERNTRETYCGGALDTLYDLIKAGLVEKV